MARYQCFMCGLIYDEELGDEDSGIAPGTLWADIPEDWYCPNCNASKSDFELIVEDAPKSRTANA